MPRVPRSGNPRGIAGRAQTSKPVVGGSAARQQMRESAARRVKNISRRKSNGGQGG